MLIAIVIVSDICVLSRAMCFVEYRARLSPPLLKHGMRYQVREVVMMTS